MTESNVHKAERELAEAQTGFEASIGRLVITLTKSIPRMPA